MSLIKSKYNIYSELFEEWVRSILKARKDLEVLDGRNGLYVVYIERVIGRLAREVAPAAHQGKLDLEVLSKLLYWEHAASDSPMYSPTCHLDGNSHELLEACTLQTWKLTYHILYINFRFSGWLAKGRWCSKKVFCSPLNGWETNYRSMLKSMFH